MVNVVDLRIVKLRLVCESEETPSLAEKKRKQTN